MIYPFIMRKFHKNMYRCASHNRARDTEKYSASTSHIQPGELHIFVFHDPECDYDLQANLACN